jgi:hypothetical protein
LRENAGPGRLNLRAAAPVLDHVPKLILPLRRAARPGLVLLVRAPLIGRITLAAPLAPARLPGEL